MLMATLTLLPALLAIFGRAVLWPTRTAREERPGGDLLGAGAEGGATAARGPGPRSWLGCAVVGPAAGVLPGAGGSATGTGAAGAWGSGSARREAGGGPLGGRAGPRGAGVTGSYGFQTIETY